MGRTLFQKLIRIGSLVLFVGFLSLSWFFLDVDMLYKQTQQLLSHYDWLFVITACYLLAFICRAFAWKMYGSENERFRVYLYALFYSLFFNHIFPVKVGEVVRVGVLTKERTTSWDMALHSVVVMRMLDLGCLALFSLLGASLLGISLSYSLFMAIVCGMMLVGFMLLFMLKKKSSAFFSKHVKWFRQALFHRKAVWMVSLVALSWVLEAVVLYGVVQALALDLAFLQAVWINSLTVASQVFQFAPGGLATYESVMSFALVQINLDWQTAYHVAIITHGYKFLFSYVVGAVAFIFHPISRSHLKLWMSKRGEKA